MWAAEQLAAIGSVRAVPDLIAAFEKEATSAVERRIGDREVLIGDPNMYLGEHGLRFREALEKIGKPATLELLKAYRDYGETRGWTSSSGSASTRKPPLAVRWLVRSYYFLILLDVHESLLAPARSGAPSHASSWEILLTRLCDEPTSSQPVRELAAELLRAERERLSR